MPKNLKKSEFLLVNQSLFGETGSHWCILTRDISGAYELFDSLGVDHSKKQLIRKYIPERFCIIHNQTPFQAKDSTSCGKFSLYYVVNRFYNNDCSMNEVLAKIFSTDLQKNESKVQKFLRRWH